MLYDKTTINVSERSMLEIADISLHVIRDHFKPLIFTFGLMVIPLMVLNYFLIGWMTEIDYGDGNLLRYAWSMSLLVVTEAQLASLFSTYYLGHALFEQKISVRSMLKDVFGALPRIIWSHGIVRAVLIIWGLYFMIAMSNGYFEEGLEGFLIPVLVLYLLVVRALRPFITELLVLEKNPFRAKSKSDISISVRSKSLHAPVGSELFGRAIFGGMITVAAGVAFFAAVLFVWNMFAEVNSKSFVLNFILFPICLWLAVGMQSVTRFLSYLDIRTRQEGWEVELKLRAEAVNLKKLKGDMA